MDNSQAIIVCLACSIAFALPGGNVDEPHLPHTPSMVFHLDSTPGILSASSNARLSVERAYSGQSTKSGATVGGL